MGGGSSGGGGGSSTQTTVPWEGAQPAIMSLIQKAEKAERQVSKTPYGGVTYAQPNNLQTMANYDLAKLAPQLVPLSQAGQSTIMNNLTGKFLDPAMNPTLQAAKAAATASTVKEFQNSILPSLNSAAIQSGAYGGARNGIALARASDDAMKTIADTNAKMDFSNYAMERGNQNASIAQIPTILSALTAPSNTLGAAGAQQQSWDQALIDDAVNKFNAKQTAPFAGLSEMANLIGYGGGNSYSQTTTTRPTNTFGNVLSGALGGGMLGYGAASAFPTAFGLGANAMGATGLASLGALGPIGLGVAAGGLLGGLF